MERGTEYALEQIYNIVDSRYRSRKPLIVTTNLTLDEIRHPQDTAHARIYDRLLEMCIPISCIGVKLTEGERTGKAGTLKKFNRMNQKIFLKIRLDCQSSATRKWSCLLKKYYDTETDNASFIRCIDVMAKLIQKYGSTVLEQKESPLCATNSKAA